MIDTSCHCTLLRRGARALTQLYDDALAPSGIQVTQFGLLRTIERLSGEPTIGDVAQATGLDRSTLGRNLRVLAREGWVLLQSGEDARAVVVSLTTSGKDKVHHALPLWRNAQRRIDRVLDEADRERIRGFVDALEGVRND